MFTLKHRIYQMLWLMIPALIIAGCYFGYSKYTEYDLHPLSSSAEFMGLIGIIVMCSMITILPMMAVLPVLAMFGIVPLRKIVVEDERVDKNSSVFKLPRLENLKTRHRMEIEISGTEDELEKLTILTKHGYKELDKKLINVRVLDEQSMPIEIESLSMRKFVLVFEFKDPADIKKAKELEISSESPCLVNVSWCNYERK